MTKNSYINSMLDWKVTQFKEGSFDCFQYEKIEYVDPLTEEEAEQYLKSLMREVLEVEDLGEAEYWERRSNYKNQLLTGVIVTDKLINCVSCN